MALGGGEMISDVFLDHSTYAEPPSRLVNCKRAILYFSLYFNLTIIFSMNLNGVENFVHSRYRTLNAEYVMSFHVLFIEIRTPKVRLFFLL